MTFLGQELNYFPD